MVHYDLALWLFLLHDLTPYTKTTNQNLPTSYKMYKNTTMLARSGSKYKLNFSHCMVYCGRGGMVSNMQGYGGEMPCVGGCGCGWGGGGGADTGCCSGCGRINNKQLLSPHTSLKTPST